MTLIRGWQRLRDWVDQDREFLRTRERIAVPARLWPGEGRLPDRLLSPGRPLAEGEDLLANRRADLEPLLVEFIEASTAAAAAAAEEKAAAAAAKAQAERDAKAAAKAANLAVESSDRMFTLSLEQATSEQHDEILRSRMLAYGWSFAGLLASYWSAARASPAVRDDLLALWAQINEAIERLTDGRQEQ